MAAQRDYSDLEVASRLSIAKVPTVSPGSPEPVSAVSASSEPLPAYFSTTRNLGAVIDSKASQSDLPIACNPNSDDASSMTQLKVEESLPPRPRRFAQIRRKYLILGGAVGSGLVLLMVILLAVLLTRGSKSTPPASPFGMSQDSKLSAINWTDPTGVDRAAVFFQGTKGDLNYGVFDGVSRKWAVQNITASIINGTSLTGVDVMPGTPLAAVTNRFQLSLYYLTTDAAVAEVFTTDPTGKSQWSVGALGSTLQPQAAPNSRLAALWQICATCSGSLIVLYEDPSHSLRLANLTNGVWASVRDPISSSPATPGTGLAISPFADFGATGPTGTDPSALRVYHAATPQLFEFLSGPLVDFRWETGNFGRPLSANMPTSLPVPEIASISYGTNGWVNNLVNYLKPSDGTLVSHRYDGRAWSVAPPSFVGGPGQPSFSSIATTQAMRLYGKVDGLIYEYRTTPANPFTWTFVGPVGPAP